MAQTQTKSADSSLVHSKSGAQMLQRRQERCKMKRRILLLAGCLVLVFLCSFSFGRYRGIPLGESIRILLSAIVPIPQTWPEDHAKVILLMRFPRIFSAVLVGAALALSGAAYQTVFKNPLVSPDILGASSGASLGAAIALFLGFPPITVQVMAFVFSMLSILLTWFVSRCVKRDPVLALILAGIFVSSLANAVVSLIKFVADPNNKLPTITYWLMGSLNNVDLASVTRVLLPMVLAALPLFILRWRLNVLSMGEDEAKALGVETRQLRMISILCATVLTASAISIAGLIGWVGLVIPHLMRMFVGVDNKYLIPSSVLAGGTFLLLVDNAARALSTEEIPIGVLTAIIGAPFFILLMVREGRGS